MNKSIIKWVHDINKTKVFHFLLVIAFVILGALYIYNTWTTTMNETSKEAMNIARTAEASFIKDALNKLDVSPNDIENPIYDSTAETPSKMLK